MGNSYFQFKQFKVQQERCAMKVSTDACIQGAWSPVQTAVKNVLDIGCGTGLLSLMLAQRNDSVHIDAMELDESAALQAKENIDASPWAGRMHAIHADVKQYAFQCQYDMVICNPPFFINSLKAAEAARNNARHDVSLSQEELFNVLSSILVREGYASVMLPVKEHVLWERLCAERGWSVFSKLYVQPKEGYEPNRIISLCDRGVNVRATDEVLTIRNNGDTYTEAFTELLRPFYLFL